MSLASLVRCAVDVAHDITNDGGLQVTFTHEAATTTLGESGEPTWSTGVSRTGVYTEKQSRVMDEDGNEKTSSSMLTVLGSTTFTVRDKLTVNGTVRPILKINASLGSDNAPFLSEIFFG